MLCCSRRWAEREREESGPAYTCRSRTCIVIARTVLCRCVLGGGDRILVGHACMIQRMRRSGISSRIRDALIKACVLQLDATNSADFFLDPNNVGLKLEATPVHRFSLSPLRSESVNAHMYMLLFLYYI